MIWPHRSSMAQSSLDCLRRPPDQLRAQFARSSTELFTNRSPVHSEFIALSFNEATKNDVASHRHCGGAWESSPKGKEGRSKKHLSGEVREPGSRTQLDG
jgi:hypothetical protein